MGTTIFPILLVFTEPSLPVSVFGAGTPEVASPTADDCLSMSVAEVLMVSLGTAANDPAAEVVAGSVPSAAVLTPGVRWSVSSLALD